MHSVSHTARAFAPTLVTTQAILANGPTVEDLERLAGDLDRFGADLLAAADATEADLPEPLVASLETAVGAVQSALNPH
jgi:hypothetical protein